MSTCACACLREVLPLLRKVSLCWFSASPPPMLPHSSPSTTATITARMRTFTSPADGFYSSKFVWSFFVRALVYVWLYFTSFLSLSTFLVVFLSLFMNVVHFLLSSSQRKRCMHVRVCARASMVSMMLVFVLACVCGSEVFCDGEMRGEWVSVFFLVVFLTLPSYLRSFFFVFACFCCYLFLKLTCACVSVLPHRCALLAFLFTWPCASRHHQSMFLYSLYLRIPCVSFSLCMCPITFFMFVSPFFSMRWWVRLLVHLHPFCL